MHASSWGREEPEEETKAGIVWCSRKLGQLLKARLQFLYLMPAIMVGLKLSGQRRFYCIFH